MNNKKTIILTFSLATILILGILVFSNGVQNAWQATSEVENNIDVSNGNNILLASNIDYPYDSIKNIDDSSNISDIIYKSQLYGPVPDSTIEFAPLQESVNIVGEFIKLNYGLTQVQNTTAYIGYSFMNGVHVPEIYYYIDIDGNRFSAMLSGFTNELIGFNLDYISTLSKNLEIHSADDANFSNTAVSEDNLLLIDNKVREILNILGYTQSVESSESTHSLVPCDNGMLSSDTSFSSEDYFILFSTSVKLSDESIISLSFTKTNNDMILRAFTDHTLLEKHRETATSLRVYETNDEPKINSNLSVDFPYSSFKLADTGLPYFPYAYTENDTIIDFPSANLSLQMASNMMGEIIKSHYPDISPTDITAFADYLEGYEHYDFDRLGYFSYFTSNGIDIYVLADINPMTFEIYNFEMLYYDEISSYEIPLNLSESELGQIIGMPVEEDVKALIDENLNSTLKFLGYDSDIGNIDYVKIADAYFPNSGTSHYLAYEISIVLEDNTYLIAQYSGNSQKVNLQSIWDNSAYSRFTK